MSRFKARQRTAILIVATALSLLGASPALTSTTAPSQIAPAQTTDTFCVTDDTRVEQLHPNDNYGGDLRVEVDTISPSGRQERIDTYLKFDLSSIPSGVAVTSATFNITVRSGGTGGTLFDINLHAVADSSWSQGTLTWNNRPALGPVLAMLPARMLPGDLVSVGLPTSFYSGPGPYSFGLAYPDGANHSDGIDFVTLEDPVSDSIACLNVTYGPGTSQPPTIAAIPNQTLNVDQVVEVPVNAGPNRRR